MKKTFTLLLSLTAFSLIAQETPKPINEDTTKIKIGNMTIIFDNKDEGDFDFNMDEGDEGEESSGVGIKTEITLGMNGWLNTSNSTTFDKPYQDMSLELRRSRAFGMHFVLDKADIFNHHLFISPGIGITWNNYHFENKNMSITTGGDTTMFRVDSNLTYDKYKLRATYLEVPLTIGGRIGNVDKTYFTIEAGVIGGFNIGSMVKQRHYISEVKNQSKINDDFNLNPFKLDAIVKLRISDFVGLYGRYSFTSMFEQNKTQEVYPFSIGVTFGGI